MALSYKIYKNYLSSNLEMQCEKDKYFSFNFGGNSIQLDIFH